MWSHICDRDSNPVNHPKGPLSPDVGMGYYNTQDEMVNTFCWIRECGRYVDRNFERDPVSANFGSFLSFLVNNDA